MRPQGRNLTEVNEAKAIKVRRDIVTTRVWRSNTARYKRSDGIAQ